MSFESVRAADTPGEPSLADMTRAAIARLSHGPKGYVLVVNAGGIDAGHHQGSAYRALTETIALSDAVRAAMAMVSTDDTLVIVTADHSHTLTIAGYPRRGSPILGLNIGLDGKPVLDDRGRPFTTLTYANGPGFTPDGKSAKGAPPPPLTDDQVTRPGYQQQAAVPLPAEAHGGEDVAIYAIGPGSQWVRGTVEQNVLYWMMHAALWPAPPTAQPSTAEPPPAAKPAPSKDP
jgi:alkaline phosphatase